MYSAYKIMLPKLWYYRRIRQHPMGHLLACPKTLDVTIRSYETVLRSPSSLNLSGQEKGK